MVEVVADAGGQQYADVFARQLVPQQALVHEAVHHLRHAEAVPEVVERVVAVVLLYAQLYATHRTAPRSRTHQCNVSLYMTELEAIQRWSAICRV